MTAATETLMTPVRPNEQDVRLARRSSSQLRRFKNRRRVCRLTVAAGETEEELKIPAIAYHMLEMILGELAQGHAVALSPVDREVTTQKAADLLNVSRPHLIK